MRVVFCVLDSMPTGALNAEATPNLWEQVTSGNWAPEGGLSLPLSVTYSNHAAFVTGADPSVTGVWGNRSWNGEKFIHTWDAGPCAPTLFDRCLEADRRSVAIVGDQKLVATMGAQVADTSWPPGGDLPEGTALDLFGYAADSAVIEQAHATDLGADFVFLHLNEPDTTLHLFGPDSPEANAQMRVSDASYGQLIEALRPAWDDTVLITVSDHQQTQITNPDTVDLYGHAKAKGWDAKVSHEGTGGIVIGDISEAQVAEVPGIAGTLAAAPGVVICWPEPHTLFFAGDYTSAGNHGCPPCRPQVAIVSGGHSAATELGEHINQYQPGSLTWAPAIAGLLGL